MKLPKPILQFLNWFPHQGFAWLACAVFLVGLLVGRAMVSIGMMLLVGNALINLKAGETLRQFAKDRSSHLLVGIFLLYAISFFWSENQEYYLSRLQIMLPFLTLPVVMHSIKWDKKWFDYFAILAIGVSVVGVCMSLYSYSQDYENINAGYGISKSLPTPFGGDHIRFGVFVVVGISFCIQFIKEKKWRWVVSGLALFLIVYLHILASKTALLSLYLIVILEIYFLVKRQKNIKLGIAILISVFVLPILFFAISDSFRNKVYYTQYAFYEMFNTESQTNVSDEGRIVSYQTSWSIIKDNWLLGVGLGDGLDAMEAEYKKQGIAPHKILYPHNQFLYVALITGLLGLLCFTLICAGVIRLNIGQSDWMFSFLLIFLVPFLVEAYLNTQYGVATFLFFFLVLHRKNLIQLSI